MCFAWLPYLFQTKVSPSIIKRWLSEPPPFPLIVPFIKFRPPAFTGNLEMTIQPYFPGENLLHAFFFFCIAVLPYTWWKAQPIPFLSLSYPWFEKGTHLLSGWQFSKCVEWRSPSSNSRPYGNFLHRNWAALVTRPRSLLKKQICIIMSRFFKRLSLRSASTSVRDSWRTLWLKSHLDRGLINIFNFIIQANRSNCVQSWNTYAMASQQAHDVVTSSYRHRCDVMTSHRRQYNFKCMLGCYTT